MLVWLSLLWLPASLSLPLSVSLARIVSPSTSEQADGTGVIARDEPVEEKAVIEPRTTFQVEFTVDDNGTEIVAPRRTILEVIPVDYLCDFCLAVINKLKERQRGEQDFETKLREECWNYNNTEEDDGTVCELVNKVNLDRLRDDSTDRICADEKLCPDREKEEAELQAREERIREENARRLEEEKEEERKRKKEEKLLSIEQAKEDVKNEASRLEYEKHIAAEEKKRAELRKANRVHGHQGGADYITDEVDREEELKNDYPETTGSQSKAQEHPVEFAGSPVAGSVGEVQESSSVTEESTTSHKETEESEDYEEGERQKIQHIVTPVKVVGGKISGDATLEKTRVLVDRTVNVGLTVDDIAK